MRSDFNDYIKGFLRQRLDQGDVIFDKACNKIFHQKLESIQYNTCLAVSRAIMGSSREKLYQQLGLESLQRQRWYKSLGLGTNISSSDKSYCKIILYYQFFMDFLEIL